MHGLTGADIPTLLLALATLLACARILGEIAARFNQPAVVGEMLAGILLGKTVLGRIAPGVVGTLFPESGPVAISMAGMTTLAIVLFLVVAGMEVDLSTVWRQGKAALAVGTLGMVVPFALGLGAAWLLPARLGWEAGTRRDIHAFFLATALSISALPVIAKTLLDLGLYRSDMGMLVIAAAVLNDLVGWIIFAILLGVMGTPAGHGVGDMLFSALGVTLPAGAGHTLNLAATVSLTLLFAVLMLTVGRGIIHRALPYLQAHTTWPGGVLSFALALALLAAAFTEWIGVHAIFGSFLVGVAVGDSSHLREQTRTIIHQFVSFIFAPLFFAGIGLSVDFAAHFDAVLIVMLTVLACISKVVGCGLGGRWSGMPPREAWAVGFGLNARGGMVIILSLLALESNVIGERLFVGLVVMAMLTSMMSGPLMQRILGLRRRPRLSDHLSPRAFVNPLAATTRQEAIRELAQPAAAVAGLDSDQTEAAVLAREQLMSTGVGHGLAVPHARIAGLPRPVMSVGLSEAGVDFDAPDGDPAQVIFLILTPLHDNGAQLEILADIARFFQDESKRGRALRVNNYTEFLALLNTE